MLWTLKRWHKVVLRVCFPILIATVVFDISMDVGRIANDRHSSYQIDIDDNHVELKGAFQACFSMLNGTTVKRTRINLFTGPGESLFLNIKRYPGQIDDKVNGSQFLATASTKDFNCIMILTKSSLLCFNFWGDPEMVKNLRQEILVQLNEDTYKRISYKKFKSITNQFECNKPSLKDLEN